MPQRPPPRKKAALLPPSPQRHARKRYSSSLSNDEPVASKASSTARKASRGSFCIECPPREVGASLQPVVLAAERPLKLSRRQMQPGSVCGTQRRVLPSLFRLSRGIRGVHLSICSPAIISLPLTSSKIVIKHFAFIARPQALCSQAREARHLNSCGDGRAASRLGLTSMWSFVEAH